LFVQLSIVVRSVVDRCSFGCRSLFVLLSIVDSSVVDQ